MELTINLTPSEANALRLRAREAGLDDESYLKRELHLGEQRRPSDKLTPSEMVCYWEKENLFGAFADCPDSPQFAEQLRVRASNRGWD